MDVICLHCGNTIPDFNVTGDVIMCRHCQKGVGTDAVVDRTTPAVDLARPPQGAWYRERRGLRQVGATVRSVSTLCGVPLMVLGAVVSLVPFLMLATRTIATVAAGRLPPLVALVAAALCLAIGAACVLGGAMLVVGEIVVTVTRETLEVFMGLGRFGWGKRFRLVDVWGATDGWPRGRTYLVRAGSRAAPARAPPSATCPSPAADTTTVGSTAPGLRLAVSPDASAPPAGSPHGNELRGYGPDPRYSPRRSDPSTGIMLVGTTRYTFGTELTPERRRFVREAIRKVLLEQRSGRTDLPSLAEACQSRKLR